MLPSNLWAARVLTIFGCAKAIKLQQILANSKLSNLKVMANTLKYESINSSQSTFTAYHMII